MMKDVDFRRYFSQKTGTPLVQKPADLIPTLREYSIRSQHPSIAVGNSIEMVRPGRIGSDFVDNYSDLVNKRSKAVLDLEDLTGNSSSLQDLNNGRIKYLADGDSIPSSASHRINNIDNLKKAESVPITLRTSSKDVFDKPINKSFTIHVFLDENSPMPDLSMFNQLNGKIPIEAVSGLDGVYIIASTADHIKDPSIPIKGWIIEKSGKRNMCLPTYYKYETLDPITGKPTVIEYSASGEDLLNTFLHEGGHNVSFNSKTYRLQEDNFRRAHELLLEFEDYDSLFEGSPYFQDFDEFFAETFRYAVKDKQELRRIEEALNAIAKKNDVVLGFSLSNLFTSLLR